MKKVIFSIKGAMLAVLTLAAHFCIAEPVLISYLDFNDGKIPNDARCSFGAQQGGNIAVVEDTSSAKADRGRGSLQGSYPLATGGMYVWGGCDIKDLNTNDVYIEFYAKMPGLKKQGLKFLKVFGQRNIEGYSNTTIGLDYTGIEAGTGSLYAISFGDGTTAQNDTQKVIYLSSKVGTGALTAVGRSQAIAKITKSSGTIFRASAWGDGWHHFRVHIKYNTGTTKENEVADGEYYIEINGTPYIEAKNLFNRHYSNLPIQKISFFDWAQGGTAPFEIWYDDITISTGGFMSRTAPYAPLSR